MKHLGVVATFVLMAPVALLAQEGLPFTFQVGGGFTQPIGSAGAHLDEGWNVQGGAGLRFGPIGIMADVGYNSFGINSTTLSNLGVPGGDVHILSATLDPVIHLTPRGRFDIYVTGGAGIYHRYQEFTQPAVGTVVGFDPFFGFYPAAVPVNQVLASYSVNKPGFDAGAGIALGTKWHGKIYAEAKFNRIIMGNGFHTDYIPVTFGFRW